MNYDTTPTAEKWFKKLNEEYAKGIIDSECFVTDADQYYEKIKSGNVLGMVDQYWNFNKATNELPDECKYIPLGIVIEDGIEEHYHSQVAFNDSTGLGISVSCDDVDGALKFINDLLEPEILTMRFWGEEDVDYTVGDDGVFYMTDEQRQNRNEANYNTDRICPYTYFPYYWGMNQDGINAYSPQCQPSEFYERLSDIVKECFDAYGVKTYTEMLNKAEENPDWYPMWSYTATFTSDTEYGKAKENMDKIKKQYLPAVVMGSDFEAEWNKYIKAYEENCDVDAYLNELNAEIKRRCEK
jgi:putative aldouronate transport system substrate-binding protein